MISLKKLAIGTVVTMLLVAACSSSSGGGGGGGGSQTVVTKSTGAGTVLVAGSNSMTVYTFASDAAGSGTSACTGACITKWPALTVPAGTTPTAGSGVTGTVGTITRADNGALQVTYNVLPLYFYSGDSAPGDTNGNYPGWSSVKP